MKRMNSTSKRCYLFFAISYVILIGIQTIFFNVLKNRVEQEKIEKISLLEGEVIDLEQSIWLLVNQMEEILSHDNLMSSLYDAKSSSDQSTAKVKIDEIVQSYIEFNHAIVGICIVYDNNQNYVYGIPSKILENRPHTSFHPKKPEAKSFLVRLTQMPDNGCDCLIITKRLYGQKKERSNSEQIGTIIFLIDPSRYINPVIKDSYTFILDDGIQSTSFDKNTGKQKELFRRKIFEHQIQITVYEQKNESFQISVFYLWLFCAILIFILMYNFLIYIKKDISYSTKKRIDETIQTTRKTQKTQSELHEMELSNKFMTLYALQSQINPHFLYNTLQCIRGIALKNGMEEIGDICTSLSQIFRYSIKGKSLTCLGEELKIAKKYIEVMNIRFEGRFQFHFTIDSQLYDAKVSKMIFQPILENTYLHNIENESTTSVNVYSEYNGNSIAIYFKEYSPHTSEERINKVNDQIHQQAECKYELTNEVGLINIYQRLVTVFGDKADLKIYKQENFLCTCLWFPYIKMDHQTN